MNENIRVHGGDTQSLLRVHHVGYLVDSIADAEAAFAALGYAVEQPAIYDEARVVDISFMIKDGQRVELVAPREGGKLFKSLKKRIGAGPYHICYDCTDYERAVAELTECGYMQVQPLLAAPAIDGRRVAFFYHSAIGMVELIE